MSFLTILSYLVLLGVGGVGGYIVYQRVRKEELSAYKKKIGKAEHIAAEIVEKAEKNLKEAEEKARLALENAQRDIDKRYEKIDQVEERLIQKEEKIDQKYDSLEKEKENIAKKSQELDALSQEQREKLSQIAKLSYDDAKQELLSIVEQEQKKDILAFVEKFKTIKQEEAEKESVSLLTKILPRIAMNSVSEYTVSSIDIPSEDVKGKLIGREGRNVSYFEKISGVEVLIDDTPLIVKLSSYDPEKRYIATETLKRLVKDGRINPVYIEKTYTEVLNSLEDLLIDKGKEALQMLNLPMMKPDVMRMIGQFHLRYSYGQNLWIHSIEVARIAESLAVEMGLDGLLAKRAGLLHDIGKVVAANGQSHTKIGAEVLRKYGFDDVIVNAAEAHHYDVPITHPIGWIVTAADALSAGRP